MTSSEIVDYFKKELNVPITPKKIGSAQAGRLLLGTHSRTAPKVKCPQGRSSKDKTAVLGIVQRGGKLIAKTVENVQSDTLTQEILTNVKKGASVYTDEWIGYKEVSKTYNHGIVRHAQHQYVNGKAHTNTIEGLGAFLKRGIIGIYHFTSKKHLDRYLDEFSYRYNARHLLEKDRFEHSLSQCDNRLKYKYLISKTTQ